MRVSACDEYLALQANAWSFLAADEANHTVLLSSLQAAIDAIGTGETPPDPCVARLAQDDRGLVALGLFARENWLLSTGPADALAAIGAQSVAQQFAGVAGPGASVAAFMRGHGGRFEEHARLPLMRLERPLRECAFDGRLQPAGSLERDLVLEWAEAFRSEARMPDPAERFRAAVERGLAQGVYYLWQSTAGKSLCLAGGRLIAPTSARIGPVYTPPPLRGRGYGQAAVTALAAHLQRRGARTVFLFTDAANPTSNALYLRIGFRLAGEHRHMLLKG